MANPAVNTNTATVAPAAPPPGPQDLGPGQRQTVSLRSARFRKEREETWRTLDKLVSRLEKKGLKALNADEAQQLPILYRATLSSLSVARGIVLDRNLLLYLENLSLRAYLAVYGPRTGLLENLGSFFGQGFPRAVRGIRVHMAIALLAMLLGAVAGYALVQSDMNYYTMLVPSDIADERGPGSSTEELRDIIFGPWEGFVDGFIVFANSLFRHNTIVGLLCFGLSFALGIPTLLLLAYNGLILGAFVSLHVSKGLGLDILAWLSIHGVTEILAVLLCGGAGLAVAEKIIFPGGLSRLDSLAKNGRQAAKVVAGAVVLFFIAGIIEGGFRQLVDNTAGRFAFAAMTAALWYAYFALVGRGGEHARNR